MGLHTDSFFFLLEASGCKKHLTGVCGVQWKRPTTEYSKPGNQLMLTIFLNIIKLLNLICLNIMYLYKT